MASSKEYLDYVLDLLPETGVACRPMMGEYVLYYRDKVFGGVYDDRFLVKSTKSARAMMPDAEPELPYEGAKEMLPVDSEDRVFLRELLEATYADLPAPKSRSSRKKA